VNVNFFAVFMGIFEGINGYKSWVLGAMSTAGTTLTVI
jgi:hypothetical protein